MFNWKQDGVIDDLRALLGERDSDDNLTYVDIGERLGEKYGEKVTGEMVRYQARKLKLGKEFSGAVDASESSLLTKQLRERIRRQDLQIKAYEKLISGQRYLNEVFEKHIPHIPVIEQVPTVFPADGLLEEEIGVVWSDHHAGQCFSGAEMEGFNEYNFDIFADRMWNHIKDVITETDILRGKIPIKTLNIYALGDHVSGDIHEELKVTNDPPIIPACVQTASIFAQSIVLLSQHFDRINVYTCPGNHARLTKKKGFNQIYSNFDTLIWNIATTMLFGYIQEGKVFIDQRYSSEYVVDTQGWRILISHGDEIKSHMGIPFYGIERNEAKQKRLRNDRHLLGREQMGKLDYDYHLIGHFHTHNRLNNVLMNGSMVGPDPFSKIALHVGSIPSQKFFTVNPEKGIGRITDLKCHADEPNQFLYDISQLDRGLLDAMAKVYNPITGEVVAG